MTMNGRRERNDKRATIGLRAPIIAATLAGAAIGTAQTPFPEGPARDTVVVVCSQCHPLTRLLNSELSAAQWEIYLYDMVARGATIYDRDLERVKSYLIDNFATDAR